jgi:hypothetical protein
LPVNARGGLSGVVLRHAVGKSTLAEGFAVPRGLEHWIQAPDAGHKRTIYLLFNELRVPATLRRLANARRHVQVRYQGTEGRPFREWLANSFRSSSLDLEGEYIELSRISENEFRVCAFPASSQPDRHLAITEWLFHRTSNDVFERYAAAREIPAIVRNIKFNRSEGQNYYNMLLSSHFSDWNWETEKQVIPELPLRCDFLKDAVQVEVEFGNARTYYQDFIKFMLAYNQQAAEVGILVVPSEAFARQLCEVGRKRAVASGRHYYSGMIHLGKVRRELEFLKFMLKMPIAVPALGSHRAR